MKRQLRVGLLYGGQSAEHAVSMVSAANVFDAMDKAQYEVLLVWIDETGKWHLMDSPEHIRGGIARGTPIFVAPHASPGSRFFTLRGGLVQALPVDVVFPVLHGTNGEDGTVQGFLETVGVPCVGAGVLASAVCMDKDVSKRLLQHAGLPVADFIVLHRNRPEANGYASVVGQLGTPFFLKPANAGSSVGISKIRDVHEFVSGLADAFTYDEKVLAERYIHGRELECAVMGDEHPRVSVAGEITTDHEFYSYEAKYLDEQATCLIIPAQIPNATANLVRTLARDAYMALGCEGMARVDFFKDAYGAVFVNEVNTIPGFTSQSMFPMLWQHSGVGFSEIVNELVPAALRRFEARRALRRKR